MKVFSYVIVNDDGSAPNYDAPMTTLAICKPKIRLYAQPGDLVIAFAGQTLGPEPHAVRWAGVVTEKMTFAEYWNAPRFVAKRPGKSERPDNIYKPSGTTYEQVNNPSHTAKNISRDLGGAFVLAFETAWRFGPVVEILPEEFGLRLSGARRGHRVCPISAVEWGSLKKWLNNHCPADASRKTPRHNKRSSC